MRGINKAIIVGTLGRDAEKTVTQAGNVIVNFSVAVNERYKKKGSNEYTETTEWLMIVMFGERAEKIADYLKKGTKVYLEGKIHTEKWQDKQGNDRWTTKIHAWDVQLLGDRPNCMQPAPKKESEKKREQQSDPEFDDPIPF